jgi:RimK family alpha-L-glutamate ligase
MPRSAEAAPILVLTAWRDWHARALAASFRRRGAAVAAMRLEDCAFDTTAPCGLRFGAMRALPRGVFVRSVAAGSFEAVTRRLGILHALARLGVPVWNDAAAIERCVDKSMTTFLLAQAGLPTPATWAVEGFEAARRIAEAECARGPLVLKPLFGSQGRGLKLVAGPDDLPPPEEVAGVYYLQRYVGSLGPEHSDYRLFVVEGAVAAQMARRATSWITNVKQGARPSPARFDGELAELAVQAAAAVGARYCGVDILRTAGGRAYVLEVNSMPAWSGLQSVSRTNVADALAAAFCRAVGVGARRAA